MLAGLHELQLGPRCIRSSVADAMDQVAEDCSPFADVSENPAKDLAMGLAEAQPLVWGGSVLAARASRRLAEALRAASGRAALAADADALLPILEAAAPRDPFADPFEDAVSADRRPCLVLLDDGNTDEPDPVRPHPAAGRGRAQRHPGLRHRALAAAPTWSATPPCCRPGCSPRSIWRSGSAATWTCERRRCGDWRSRSGRIDA